MKIIGVFNRIGPGNIGLENLIRQRRNTQITILTTSQNSADAQQFISEAYPERAKDIIIKGNRGKKPLLAICELLKKESSIVHAHHSFSAFISAISRTTGRFTLVTTAHNDFQSYRFAHKILFLISFIMSDEVICNSQATLKSLPRLVNRSKVSVIYNGVDFTKIDKALKSHKSPHSKSSLVVGTIARMVPQKDLPTLVKAFSIAQARIKVPISLCIVGDGPDKQELENLVSSMQMQDFVEFAGNVPRDQAYRYLSDMDIFVVSSQWEGFCNAMVEAGAAGKPIIASHVEPLPEVIGNHNALFFKVGDYQMLAKKIVELIKHPGKRTALGQKAYRFTRDRYSLDESADRYHEVYERLVREQSGGGK